MPGLARRGADEGLQARQLLGRCRHTRRAIQIGFLAAPPTLPPITQ